MTIHNAFSPHYVSEISLKAENREVQLSNASTKKQREKIVLVVTANKTYKVKTETWSKGETTC